MSIYRHLARMFFYIGVFFLPLTAYSFFLSSPYAGVFFLLNTLLVFPGLVDMLLSYSGKLSRLTLTTKPTIPWNILISEEEKEPIVKTGNLFVILSLAWLLAAAFFSLIFMAAGFSWVDALFEAMSGLTTSGLSVLPVEKLSPDLILLRSFLGWIGGLGILGFALSAVKGITGRKIAEIYGIEEVDFLSAIRRVFWAYVILTIIAFFILLLAGFDVFSSVNLALAGISNNGFLPFGSYAFTPLQKYALSLVMFLGSVSILFYSALFFRREILRFFNEDFFFYIVTFVIFVIVYHFVSSQNFETSFFYISTTMTTGGFDIADVSSVGDGEAFLLAVAMLMGGMYLSTAGGIKSSRILLIMKSVAMHVRGFFLSERRIEKLRFRNSVVEEEEILNVFAIATLYLFVFLIFSLFFLMEGYSFKDSIILVSSALGNVGVSPLPLSSLPTVQKITLTFLMYVGRIEIVPFIALVFKVLKVIR